MAPKWTAKKNNLPTNVPDRKMFPLYWSPDRLGNEFPPIRGTPNCGPGRYDTYLLTVSPGPAVYQRRLGRDRTFKPSSVPFGSSTASRRQSSLNKLVVPGPGTYQPNEQRNQHVTWPMKFGAPDWNLVPAPQKRTLRIELASDKEFRKHRNRVAYFSLYF
ncbi:protein pitchfork-like isoform X2 [Stegostoma tigrinum]|uniref:protein pitchfork-like isoform X2 n=1 Tax=Stegostoma tigrinum TaxID=3053191 RepID=UPI00202B302B|nr:protein pitchfork-like isoform X2 [Stegostoma tigrinum]